MLPSAIRQALDHVRSHHPDVTRVTFYSDDDFLGWTYADDNGNAPHFGPEIDVSLLEAALDAAWEDAPFPATYTVTQPA